MDLQLSFEDRVLLAKLSGRLDSFGSSQVAIRLESAVREGVFGVVVDMSEVDYISSAGLRLLDSVWKKTRENGGVMMLASLHEFCRSVMEIKGVLGVFDVADSVGAALDECRRLVAEKKDVEFGKASSKVQINNGELRFVDEFPDASCSLHIVGDVADITSSSVTPEKLVSRSFAESEFSLGVGALGETDEDCLPLLGEMMTVSGSMFWLPTDGNDTADFLSPGRAQEKIMIRTPFEISLPNVFNEYVFVDMDYGKSISMESLYDELFKRAAVARPGFKGLLSLVMLAETGAFYGKAIGRSPVPESADSSETTLLGDGECIGRDCDMSPRHRNLLTLVCGVGLDIPTGAAFFRAGEARRVFRFPSDISVRTRLLENSAAVFRKVLFPEHPFDMRLEAEAVIKNGVFVDFRAVQDITTISRAFVGVSWIDRMDFSARPATGASTPLPPHFYHDTDLHGISRKAALGFYKKSMRR